MFLQKAELLNFKNLENTHLSFTEGINCFVGPNGVGKTNLLDAIHYLSLTRSAFNTVDAQNITHGMPYFAINATVQVSGTTHALHCSIKRGEKKVFKCDKKEYDKISQHIGRFPAVLVTPYDTDLVREGSEFRRKYFDSVIAQIDAVYLENLVLYNQALKQRNALLKHFAETGHTNHDLLEPYNLKIIGLGQAIHQRRQAFIDNYLPWFQEHYRQLSQNQEQVGLAYHSDAAAPNFAQQFTEAIKKDLALQRTTMGIHKDDYRFLIGQGHPLKKYGSQGQQKTYVIALKMAQFNIVSSSKGFKPFLLLDDIFDKLDDRRISILMEMVAGETFGQLFVTDARPERTLHIFEGINANVNIYELQQGQPRLLTS